jgi:ubiquinone/menaquinone biosynthesis C-methylase UbiE
VIVNRDEAARGPATAFASIADAYERARPGYPEEAVRWLAGDEPRDVVDLGAGTGKLTRTLVALGHRVTAIEPLAEMRAWLESVLPDVTALAGSAEALPLRDASADVVVCAQSFHWFDHTVALPEIARVLRPGGRLALVWNTRDEREPWVKRLSALIGTETVGRADAHEPVAASGLFGPVERAEFACEQLLDRDTLRDLVLSRSYCAKLDPAEREPVVAAVAALYDEVAGPDGLVLPYVTECFRSSLAK